MGEYDWMALAEEKREQIVRQLSDLVAVNSIEDLSTTDPEGDVPYGAGPRKALDLMLDFGRQAGFAVKDFRGRAGRVECGAGEEIVGILAHLDIVPAGEGWQTDPFQATIIDGRIHGRGVLDDKGPAVAALAAMEIAASLVPQPKRQVHLILGCNEETGMSCMHYYRENVPDQPTFGVTPDNAFPVIFGEKAILRFALSGAVDSAIRTMEAGTRPNVVPNFARATVELGGRSQEEVSAAFQSDLTAHDLKGTLSFADSAAQVEFKGVSCHAQQPSDGVNAAVHLFAWVGETFDDP